MVAPRQDIGPRGKKLLGHLGRRADDKARVFGIDRHKIGTEAAAGGGQSAAQVPRGGRGGHIPQHQDPHSISFIRKLPAVPRAFGSYLA